MHKLITSTITIATACLALVACGGSTTQPGGGKTTSRSPKKATAIATPVALNTSQQATLGSALGLAIARCTIGNVPRGGSQDGQITSNLNSFVALYKSVGGKATVGGGKPTTMSAEAQKMTGLLSCDPALAQILVSGTGATSTAGAATTTTAAATANPRVAVVCTKIEADVQALGTGTPTEIGHYGTDVEKLIPIVSGSQEATVITSVGDIEKVLQAMSTGSSGTAQLPAMVADGKSIAAICSGAS
jgi:hypothetical protein